MSDAPSELVSKRILRQENAEKRTSSLLRASVFRYYIHDGVAVCRLQLIGELTDADVPELSGCWRTARTILGSRALVLDLRGLNSVDEAGKQWLASMAQEGATYQPESYLRDLVAGKHTPGDGNSAAPLKAGFWGRVLAMFRGVRVAAAK